ncbi:MAG: DUF2141 domain-containing protein [Spirochaetia bacterium]
MDKNIFGMPIEEHCFSNNARGHMGPPAYRVAVFDHNSNTTEQELECR